MPSPWPVARFIEGDMRRLSVEQADAELENLALNYPAWHQRWYFTRLGASVDVVGNTDGAVYATYTISDYSMRD